MLVFNLYTVRLKQKGIEISDKAVLETAMTEKEIQLMRMVANFPAIVAEAGKVYSPALIANFVYDMAKRV